MEESLSLALFFLMNPLNCYSTNSFSLEHIIVFYDYYKYIPIFIKNKKALSSFLITRFFERSFRIPIIYQRIFFTFKDPYLTRPWLGKVINLTFYLKFFKAKASIYPNETKTLPISCWYATSKKRVCKKAKKLNCLDLPSSQSETLRVFLTQPSI